MPAMQGITNVNEFYSAHYVSAILAGDIREVLDRWRSLAAAESPASPESEPASESPTGTPMRRLAALAQPFFRLRDRLSRLRDPAARVDDHAAFVRRLLTGALDFTLSPRAYDLGAAGTLPVLGVYLRGEEPLLWIVAATSPHGEAPGLLERPLLPDQSRLLGPEAPPLEGPTVERPLEATLDAAFALDEPPRYVLLVSDTELLLLDRGKWSEKRMLRFELEDILGHRETPTLEAVAALLHRECLAPEAGPVQADRLDERSHRHAYAVSEDLKFALRESIEALGNEVVFAATQGIAARMPRIEGDELARQCLRYMYRLLFLLYVEARPELGYAPTGAEAWRLGYGLEPSVIA